MSNFGFDSDMPGGEFSDFDPSLSMSVQDTNSLDDRSMLDDEAPILELNIKNLKRRSSIRQTKKHRKSKKNS